MNNKNYRDEISESDEDLKPFNQEIITMEGDIDFENDVLQSRDIEIAGIHSQVVQVNSLFRELQNFVLESSEVVGNIQIGVFNATNDVKVGTSELQDAHKEQKGQTNRTCIIAIIVVFVAVVLVGSVILALKLKPQQ